MIVREGVTRLVDQFYADEPDEGRWMEGIGEAAEEAFDALGPVQVSTLRLEPTGRPVPERYIGHGADVAWRFHEVAAVDHLRRLYFSGPVTLGRQVLRKANDVEVDEVVRETMMHAGCVDVCGLIGHDTNGGIVTLALGVRELPLPRQTRSTLTRLAGHLGTAFRLRRRRGGPAAALLHRDRGRWALGELAEGKQESVGDRSVLERAALAFDRAKNRVASDPDAALGYWKAMVEGKWTLVERFESDGRRVLLARPNEPKVAQLRALTAPELKVVALAALNHSAKLISYELGYAESTTSGLLASALGKLGLRHRSELVAVYRALDAGEER